MAEQIEVAVLLPPFGFHVPVDVAARSDPAVTWSDRARVVIDVDDETVTLGAVLNRASQRLQIWPEPPFERTSEALAGVSFYRPDRSEGRSKGQYFYPIVGADGAVAWDQRIVEVSIEDLIRTAEAGVLHGDPRRVYLVPQVAAGSGGEIDWSGAIDALQWILIFLQGVDGVVGGAERIRSGFSRMIGVIQRHSHSWTLRGGALGDVVALADEDWSSEELADLLKAPTSDVEVLLAWLGRSQQPEGTWTPGTTEEDAAVRAYTWAAQWMTHLGLLFFYEDGHEMAARAMAEIARHLSTGAELTEEDVRAIILRQANPAFEPEGK